MPAFRPLRATILLAAILLASGCASWNDRYTSPYDPVMRFLGAEPQGVRDWPSRDIPNLPALQTEQIPDRRPPPADPPVGWPPLAPALGALGEAQAPKPLMQDCEEQREQASQRATIPAPALSAGEPSSSR